MSLHPDRCWLEDQALWADYQNEDEDDERNAILQSGCHISRDVDLEHPEEEGADDGGPERDESAENCSDESLEAEQQPARPDRQVDRRCDQSGDRTDESGDGERQ